MINGDLSGAWQVVEAAMASGMPPRDIYIDVLAPTLHAIGAGWQSGAIGIEQEHFASNVAAALIGRLGARFARRGRKKAVVLVAMPPGERHGLGVAMLADIVTQAGYEVRNLGTGYAASSLRRRHRGEPTDLAAVVVSVVEDGRRPAAQDLLTAARRERPTVPLIAGGFAVTDERSAIDLGADGWAADPRRARGPDRTTRHPRSRRGTMPRWRTAIPDLTPRPSSTGGSSRRARARPRNMSRTWSRAGSSTLRARTSSWLATSTGCG